MCAFKASWLALVTWHPGTGHLSRCRDALDVPAPAISSTLAETQLGSIMPWSGPRWPKRAVMIGLDPIKKSMVAWKLGAGGWLLAFFRCHFASLIPFRDQMYCGRVNTSQLKIDLNFVASSQLS